MDDFPCLGSLQLIQSRRYAGVRALPAGVMPDSVEEFLVNRDIRVKNCLFTKQLFFPLWCARPRT